MTLNWNLFRIIRHTNLSKTSSSLSSSVTNFVFWNWSLTKIKLYYVLCNYVQIFLSPLQRPKETRVEHFGSPAQTISGNCMPFNRWQAPRSSHSLSVCLFHKCSTNVVAIILDHISHIFNYVIDICSTLAELLGVKWVRSGKPIWNLFYDVWNRYP